MMTTQDDNTPQYTPIERLKNLLIKRDDYYMVAGIRGGKVRTCQTLMRGATGVVTASARHSPQMQIVARLAERQGIECHCHTANGAWTKEMRDAEKHGAQMLQHKPGHNSVIIARAREDRMSTGFLEIPFGMECKEAVVGTKHQAQNLQKQIIKAGYDPPKRIIVTLGSGMTAAGILWGLEHCNRDVAWRVPVVGVQIGADPVKRLNRWAPPMWNHRMRIEKSSIKYDKCIKARIGGAILDPHYEAKLLEFIEEGDLIWVVGIRAGIEPGAVTDNTSTDDGYITTGMMTCK